jgi:tRNA nucleotidyltransferase (CCA-adding enzyme)
VGGAMRDFLLKRPVVDADLMVEDPLKPFVIELAEHLKAKTVFHEKFMTSTVILPSGKKFDIVTAREETYATPAKLPDVIATTFERDLKRRDFSINAIACFLNLENEGEILDPFKGREDMQAKQIRALHSQSFVDDPTRIFRAARFAARLNFQIEPTTLGWISDAIKKKIPHLLTPVRRRHEFELILKEENPHLVIDLLMKWKALVFIHPEWEIVPLTKFNLDPSKPDLIDRLIGWFSFWGRDRAQKMMNDLSFEKAVKAQVLSKLVQSPSNL